MSPSIEQLAVFPWAAIDSLTGDLTDRELAAILGVSREAITLRRRHGFVGRDIADRAAVALGHHPCEVWGDQWWEVA